MKTSWVAMFAAALTGLAAMTGNADDEITPTVTMTENGQGVAVCATATFSDIRELPAKAARAAWALIVCVTQPVHLFHCSRVGDESAQSRGGANRKKVWLPFYRLWGKHQGDSVIGIVYDNRATNGVAGGHWLAGYGKGGWRDKTGKTAGLVALLLIDRNNNYTGLWHEHDDEDDHGPTDEDAAEAAPSVPPVTTPEAPNQGTPDIPPVVTPEWPIVDEGTGGPVGGPIGGGEIGGQGGR